MEPIAPPAKGQGKGPIPPVAPKGKGKGPVLSQPLAKGRGKSGPVRAVVPQELVAPKHAQMLRVDHTPFKAEGTIWEGLAPFGVAPVDDGPLEGTEIDVDLLRSFWAPRLTTPTVAAEPEQRAVLTKHVSQNIQIATLANGLTPDLVRRALTEDLDVLSPNQITALAKNIAPYAAEMEASISAEVARRGGAAELSLPEAVLWAIISVPKGTVRVQVLAERCGLEEDLNHMEERLAKVEDLVLRLRGSKPLKTVLQIALAIRNIMSQRGSEGMGSQRFSAFNYEKVGHGYQNGVPPTSVLELIVRMTEATHARRARLLFHRMMAVGRLVPDDNGKRVVWSYLNDLTSSPWDCLPLLADCDAQQTITPEMASEIGLRGRHMRFMLNYQFATVTNAAAVDSGTTEVWRCQLADARKGIEEAADILDRSLLRLNAAARGVIQLFGETPRRSRVGEGTLHETAQTVLSHLRLLGRNLEVERHRQKLELTRSMKVRCLGGEAGRRRARVWPPVDTTMTSLNATSDTDLLRRLGMLLPFHNRLAGTHEGPEGVYGRDPVTGQWTLQRQVAPVQTNLTSADLLHGGADGVYVRDPITGHWVSSYSGRAHDGPETNHRDDWVLL